MSIKSVNAISFNGIRKITSYIIPTKKNLEQISLNIQKGKCKILKSDTFVPATKAKEKSLIKLTQFFNKDKLVGTHVDYVGGGYQGTREFANGIKISYSATKIGTNEGKPIFVAGTNIKSSLICAHVSHDAYDKNGKPAILTLKAIKNLQNLKNMKPINITNMNF